MVDQHYHQQRGYTEAAWTGAQGDPTLAVREVGYVTDTGEYVIGDGTTAFSGLTRFGSRAAEAVTTNAATTTDTIIVGEEFTRQDYTDASLVTVTLDTNANQAFATGEWVDVLARGAAGIEIAGATGVTVNGVAGTTTAATLAQYESARLLYLGSDVWVALTGGGGGGGGGSDTITVETESGTTFTPVLADANTYQRMTNAGAVTVTIPPNSTTAFDTGTSITFRSEGAGGVTISPGAGVTLNGSTTIETDQSLVAVKVATDEWDLTGGTGVSAGTLVEYSDTVYALSYSATTTPDPADGMWQTITLTGNVTFDLTNLTAGQTLVLDITQDGTGSRTVGFTQTLVWPGGTAFTATTTASARDRITVDYDGTTYTGAVVGQAYA